MYDPPLTQKGWEQAVDASQGVLSVLREQGQDIGAVSAVYSSPTMRTMATAAAVAHELGINSVSPAYGLNCCAAAKGEGVASKYFDRAPPEDVMRGVALGCWPPIGDVRSIDLRNRQRRGFVESVVELAAMHSPGDIVVLVTHREGLWEILRHTSGAPAAGYCCTRYFNCDPARSTVEKWKTEPGATAEPAAPARRLGVSRSFEQLFLPGAEEQQGPVAARAQAQVCSLVRTCPSSPPRPRASHRRTCPSSPAHACASQTSNSDTSTLRELLERGAGTVCIDRKGRGGTITKLWVTPGVRGVWVPNSSVSDGEMVELLSPPQPSEGNEGDFVAVRLRSGVEGWTKVKNITAPRVQEVPRGRHPLHALMQ